MAAKRILAEDILYDLVYFAFFYGIYVLLENAFWLIVPFYCNFAARQIKNIFFMLIAHLAIPAAVFLLFGDYFVLVFLIVTVIYSIIRRVRGRQTFERVTCIVMSVFLIVFYFAGPFIINTIAPYFQVNYNPLILSSLVIIIVAGSVLHSRMRRVDAALEVISRVSIQPIRQILKFDFKAMFILAFALVALTLLTHFAFTNNIQYINFQRPQIAQEIDNDVFEFFPRARMRSAPIFVPGAFGNQPHTPIIWIILQMIMAFIVDAALVVGPIILLIYGVTALYRGLLYRKNSTAFTEDGEGDTKEFILPSRLKKMKNPLEYFRWNEDKTRRMFRKKIQRYIKMGVPIRESDTPEEMALRITKEDIGRLVEEYKNVRYK